MKTNTIRQRVTFNSPPSVIYELLMDSKKHSAFSKSKAVMSKNSKGKFTVYDGYCHGHNVELTPGEKIVQAWHFAEEGWPEDHFSICTFDLRKTKAGTQLLFTQTGVPEHKVEALRSGWKEFYWEPMKEQLKGVMSSP